MSEPIQSYEMEMAALSSFMLDPVAFKLCKGIIRAEDFLNYGHRLIFKAIEWLDKKGMTTEYRAVSEALKDKNALNDVGGEDYVRQVADYVPSAASAEYYALQVVEKAELRGYEHAMHQAIAKIRAGDCEIDEIRSLVAGLPKSSRKPNARTTVAEVDCTGDDTGITTGVDGIDDALATYGYPDGQMSVVSAYHKSGKSSFMVQSFVHQAELGHRVLYVTVADLNAKRLKRRMLRALCGWSKRPFADDIFNHDSEAFDRAVKSIELGWDAEIFEAIKGNSKDIESILAQVEAWHLDKPYKCVYIDYAQKLTSSDPRAKQGRVAELDWISNVISDRAERIGIPIVVGSQITHGSNGGEDITKGSRAFEEDGGLVLRLKREDEHDATITVKWSRFGGMGTEINCRWDSSTLTFVEVPKEAVKE